MVDLKKRSSFSPQYSQKQALPYPSVHLKISVIVELPPFNFFFKKKISPLPFKKGARNYDVTTLSSSYNLKKVRKLQIRTMRNRKSGNIKNDY